MRVVCVGDCGVDRYVRTGAARPGGITLNFAAHARRLFAPDDTIHIVSALGTDAEAEIVRTAIAELSVAAANGELPVQATLVDRPGRTSVQTIDLEESGEKIFLHYEQGVLGDYRLGEDERAVVSTADLLVAAHYRQIDGFFASVAAAPCDGVRAVDFADIAEEREATDVRTYVDAFDIAFAALAPSDEALIDELDELARSAGKLIIVTLGASGSVALTGNRRVRTDAVPVARVVDTTGAGDTFAAGFLSAYCSSGNIEEALARGAREAARTVQRLGAH